MKLALFAVAVWVFMMPTLAQSQADTFALLTETEHEMFERHPAADGDAAISRNLKLTVNDGPSILVASPSGFQLKSPVNFDVRIKPKNGVPVVMSTFKVEYRLGLIWANITGRLLGHGSVIGTQLKANGAELPNGKHKVRITVSDADGRKTRVEVSFAVAN